MERAVIRITSSRHLNERPDGKPCGIERDSQERRNTLRIIFIRGRGINAAAKGRNPYEAFSIADRRVAMIVAVSCITTIQGIGGGDAGGLVSDPATGTEKLTHYRAALTIATKGQTASGPIDRTENYSLTVWSAEKAVFETIDSFDEAGQAVQLTVGKVDQAGYLLTGGATGCQAFWDDSNISVDAASLSAYLYPLKSGTSAGKETVAGIATNVYQVNSASVGIKDVQASGKVWVAADGGYLVKYHLELSIASGTKTIDYELSEINSGAPVTYPGDCLPVLTDIPATSDAQDIERMPDSLRYTSASSPDTVQAFYEKYFTGQSWATDAEQALPDGEKDLLFSQASTGREATVILQSLNGGTAVNVLANGGESSGSTPTPAGGASAETPSLPASALVITSLSKLLGGGTKPGSLPSFTLAANESMPSASGTNTLTTLQAEVQGTNVHYVLDSAGTKTEAYLFEGKEYQPVGGSIQPGSAMLSATWTLWQLDPLTILSAVGMADPKAEAGTTLEGRQVDVYSVDNTGLGGTGQDSSFGLLPVSITTIQGTIWIDHETGVLLKADLKFEANVKQPGESTPSAHGSGEFHLAVSQIGKTTVALPQ